MPLFMGKTIFTNLLKVTSSHKKILEKLLLVNEINTQMVAYLIILIS